MKSTNDNAEPQMKESTSMNQNIPATSATEDAPPAAGMTSPNSSSPVDSASLDAESADFDGFDFDLRLSDTLPEMDIIFENLYTM